jgi:hypothetical protein
MMDTQAPEGESEHRHPSYLRLVWSNPRPVLTPRQRVDLALAIQRHLTGADGLSREQFLAVYSGRCLALAPR